VPKLFDSGSLPIDIALIQVTPPNIHGRVSLGISVDIVRSAIDNASLVIAEVNPHMPWTHGDTQVDVNDLDILVPVDRPILERELHTPNEISRKIAQTVAALIPNGSTIELGLGRVPGFGRIPQVVMEFLKDRKDIGFHTEMISDTIIPLIESGAVTGAMKSIDKGKITASFCMGTKEALRLHQRQPPVQLPAHRVYQRRQRHRQTQADGGGQHGFGNRSHRPGLLGFGGQPLLFRHRRPDRLQPRRCPSESGRAIITLPSLNREGTSRGSSAPCSRAPG
jgi:acyl-CoA hydrolase